MHTAALLILAASFFLISHAIWRLIMDVATLIAKLTALSTAIDALIVKGQQPPVDLQPVADAIDAIAAKVAAASV